ncbi:hypothetical protein ACFO3I_10120 [Rheinheimera marina]|uniref:Uncharacterized protein n=1 Tax=Rheinheimera marina TaxID=1774958 RepID=A0ABV9JME0_9GAMM
MNRFICLFDAKITLNFAKHHVSTRLNCSFIKFIFYVSPLIYHSREGWQSKAIPSDQLQADFSAKLRKQLYNTKALLPGCGFSSSITLTDVIRAAA